VIVASLLAAPAVAQVLYGSVTGIVTDPQGYRVPGANIVITNTANGLTRETTTNNDGEYTIVNVQPGSYTVRISMGANFKAFERTGVNLQQGEIARVDTQLQAGTITDVVNVTSDSSCCRRTRRTPPPSSTRCRSRTCRWMRIATTRRWWCSCRGRSPT
jgi:hypothetical protein